MKFKKDGSIDKRYYPRSKDVCERIARSHAGKKLSPEHRDKVVAALTGRKCSSVTRRKIGDANRGDRNGGWKGGRYKNSRGYIEVKAPLGHPFANKKGYMLEHRLVIEQEIGRYLRKAEVVHHKNNNPLDNNIKNLIVIENNAMHISSHNRKHYGCIVDKCLQEHRARGYCVYHYNKYLLEDKFSKQHVK